MFNNVFNSVEIAISNGNNDLRQSFEVLDRSSLGERLTHFLAVDADPLPLELIGRLAERRQRAETMIDSPLKSVGRAAIAVLQNPIVELEIVKRM